MDKICKNCGSPMPAEAKFCTECGNSEFVGQAGDALREAGDNAAFGGYTSSVTGAGAPATPSPQGEGFAQPYGQQQYQQQYPQQQYQQPYGQQYPQQQYQQPYGQQPYGAPYGQPYGAPAPKKSKKGMWIAIIAIILVLGLAAVALFVWPGFLKGGSPIDGEWTGEYGETMTVKDGRISIDHGRDGTNVFEFTLDGDKLELTQISEMTYVIEGDELTLTMLDGGGKTKIAATRVSGSGGIEGVWGDLRIVDEDGDSSSISGSTMEFNGGKYVSKQQYAADIEGSYEVSGDRIVVRNTSQKLSLTYTLEGDKLTFWRVGDDGEREKVEEYVRKKYGDGEWVNDRSGFTVEFKGDKATVRNDKTKDVTDYTCVREDNKLKLTNGGETLEYIFKVIGDALTLYYQEDGVSFPEAYTRKGAETPKWREIVGRWASDSVKDFIVDDGAITEISYDDVKTTYTYEIEDNKLRVTPDDAASEPFVRTFEVVDGRFKLYDEDGEETMNFRPKGNSELAAKAIAGDLNGTWDNGYGGEIVINGDRLHGANGRDYSLKLEDGIFTVYVPDSDDTESYRYELDGDTLKLYNVDSGKLEATLTRKGGKPKNDFDTSIAGSWVDQVGIKLVINEDGAGTYDGKGVTLTAKDGRMVWTNDNDGASYNYTYKLEDGRLIIHDPNENVTWTYTREGEKPAASVDPYLLGYWEDGDGDVLTIYADGTATYMDDEVFNISAADGTMVWTEGGVSETYTYTLNGDFMTLYDESGAGFDFHRPGAKRAVTLDDLVGSWKTADGYSALITSDGIYTASDGTEYVIELQGDVMRLYIPQSEEDYRQRFTLEGDVLTFFSDDGSSIAYYREKQ